MVKHTKRDNEKIKIEKTKKISIIEGGLASVSGGVGNSYIAPFAIAMNATNQQIAWLSSFPNLLSTFFQLFSTKAIEKYGRKKVILNSVLFELLMWLPMIFSGYLFLQGVSWAINAFIIFFTFYAIFGGFAGPAWNSLMGDVIEEKSRGVYFAKRNIICGIISLISSLIAALFLDFMRQKNIFLGFTILFGTAFFFRIASRELLKKYYDKKIKFSKDYYFSFIQYIKKAKDNNFGRFTIYLMIMHFACAIASPFFAVYMLKELGFSYIFFIGTGIVSSIVSFIAMKFWGEKTDKFGNVKILSLNAFLVAMVPLLWSFSTNKWYLLFIPQIISGIGWAGFNLAAGNFIYDAVTRQRRSLCISYNNFMSGVGVFFGAMIGGLLTKVNIGMKPILVVFIVSSILRFFAGMLLLKIKEVRKVEHKPIFNLELSKYNPVYMVQRFIAPLAGFRI